MEQVSVESPDSRSDSPVERVEVTGLDALTWMLGTWSSGEGDESSVERWSRLHERAFVGLSRVTGRDGQRQTEHIVLTADDDGITYRVWPEGQAPARFRLVELGAQRVTFANPDHDFPQRISYWHDADGLHARVEGETGGGQMRSFELDWNAQPEGEGPDAMSEREVSQQRRVAASPAEVWSSLTTAAGATSLFGAPASIDLRPGGDYEILFAQDMPEGQRGSEGCSVLEVVPEQRLVVTWNSPPTIPTLRDAHTVVTIDLAAAGGAATDVSLVQRGFRSGPDWDEGHAYFQRAWGLVLDRLVELHGGD